MTEQSIQMLEGELSPRQKQLMENPVVLGGDMTVFGSSQGFVIAQRMAQALANSSMVPNEYQLNYWDNAKSEWKQNPTAIGNCIIALELASRLSMSPLMVMQNVDMIYGRPSFRGKLVKGLIDTCGRFEGLSRYEWRGEEGTEDRACRLYAIERGTSQRIDGPWVTWTMIRGEGWLDKKGSKWKTMPELMFMYRAASFFGNTNVPERLLGLPTTEELEDIQVVPTRSLEALNERLDRHASQVDAEGQEVTQTATPSPALADPTAAGELIKSKRQPRNKPVEPLPQKEEGATGTQSAEAEIAASPSPAPAIASPSASLATDFNLE